MHRIARFVAVIAATATIALGAAGSVLAGSPAVGHVYVNDNTAGRNTVSGFNRHSDGSLTPIAGSPFDAGGAGLGTPTGSAGALARTPDGRYLLAADAASDEISVLRVRPNGSLRLVDVESSNGSRPVSVAVSGDLVYVANVGAGDSNYTGFRLDRGGHLRPIPGSTFALPDDALPGQVLFGANGHVLVGTRVGPAAGPSFIDSFVVAADGRLTAAPGSPFPAQRIGPFGSAFRPTNSSQLFVSNAHDGPGAGSVSAYEVGGDGTLSAIAGSPFADNQTAPCWVAITHDGSTLFAVNTASGSVSSYAIAANGRLTLGSTTALSGSGLAAFDAALSPDDGYLYVVESAGRAIGILANDGGSLTDLGSIGGIPGAPFGIVVD
ncbi:MAG TPA: beta-propeller fold lactonase family protein [Candidatus Limnocylindrales bacterium]